MTVPISSSNGPRMVALLVVLLAGVIAAACSEASPNAPSNSTTLADGDYLLTIELGILPPIGGSPTFCMSTPGGPLSLRAGVPVRVTGIGQSWTIRMPQPSGPGGGSLEATLTASVGAVSGTIAGSARTADDAIAMTLPSPTTLTGMERSTNTFGGQIAGDVRFESNQGSLTCRSPTWTLAPR